MTVFSKGAEQYRNHAEGERRDIEQDGAAVRERPAT
jgi:hypothetical protein